MMNFRTITIFSILLLVIPSTLYSEYRGSDKEGVVCYTKEGYIAATSEEYLEQAARYSVDKDYVALQKLFKAGVIVMMKKGIKVFVVETHIFAGEVEFRIEGDTNVLWTVSEGLAC